MNPVRSHEATEVLRPPVGWDDGDPDALPRGVELPVRRSENGFQMTSWWKPTADELERLNAGGVVELVCVGTRHPIVSLGVACPELENGGLGRADVSAAR